MSDKDVFSPPDAWNAAHVKLSLQREGVGIEVQGPADFAHEVFEAYIEEYATRDGYLKLREQAEKEPQDKSKQARMIKIRKAIEKRKK